MGHIMRRDWRPRQLRLAATLALLLTIAFALPAANARAVSRPTATRIALHYLRVSRFANHPLIVFALKRPLDPGTRVYEAGPGRHAKVRRTNFGFETITPLPRGIKRRAWLFWADFVPYGLFQHPSLLLLTDVRTGAVQQHLSMNFYPLINGEAPAFLLSRDAYDSSRYRVFSNVPAGAARSADSDPSAEVVAHAARAPNLGGNCMVLIGNRVDPILAGDFPLAFKVGTELGLNPVDAFSGSDLDRELTELAKRPCRDVLLVIAAHGAAARGSNYTDPVSGHAVGESTHADVQLSWKIKGGEIRTEDFDSADLGYIMHRHRTMTFKLVVQACFSGRWNHDLKDDPQLRFIGAGSGSKQFGASYYPSTYGPGNGIYTGTYIKWDKVRQTNAVYTKTGGTLEDHTVNDTQASGFMNGMMRGLDAWAHSDADQQKTGNDLAKALVVAFQHEGDYDFASRLGATNPVIGDYSSRPEAGPPRASWDIPGYDPPKYPKARTPTQFTSTSTAAGVIDSYKWNFGDGSTGQSPAPKHTYAKPGAYDVTLTITQEDGQTSSSSTTIYVSGAGTKQAVLSDVPCSGAVGGYVDINIPSFAENPTAALTSALSGCPGKSITNVSVSFVNGPAPGSTPDQIHDEWGNEKNHLHITFGLSGSDSPGTGAATFTASWT